MDVLTWRRCPQTWRDALTTWLARQRSPHTKEAYGIAVTQFITHLDAETLAAAEPWLVTATDVDAWLQAMEASGLARNTIRARWAALSSFFEYCRGQVVFVHPVTLTRSALLEVNPCAGAEPPRRRAMPKVALNARQVKALLAACDPLTVSGARDRALLATYLLTGSRNSEVRLLRWGDLQQDGQRVVYHWRGKREKDAESVLHPAAWKAIVDYLTTAQRLESMQPEDYIFTPLSDAATRLGAQVDMQRPITRQRVNLIVKAAARRAGLRPEMVTTHTLRRTAARQFYESSGCDLDKTMKAMRHSSPATTAVYLNQPDVGAEAVWVDVGALWGL